VQGLHTAARLAIHLKEDLNRFELTDSRVVWIMTDNAFPNYKISQEQQSTLAASGIESPAIRNHILSIVHIVQLALGVFMSSHTVKGCTKSWQSHERDQLFGENESTAVGKSQRLRREGNARINQVSTVRPGSANTFEKFRLSRHFGSPGTDLHKAKNACCVDYADTWSSKQVHWL